MNVNGKVIMNDKFKASMEQIDVSKLAPGVYSIVISMEGETYTHKIIKQ
jgi:hypothetical protein